jgi:hypothetical protein
MVVGNKCLSFGTTFKKISGQEVKFVRNVASLGGGGIMLNTCDYTRVHKRGTHGYIFCTRDLPNIYNICTCMVVSLDFNPSTSQANERVVFSAYHSMWIVEFSWTSFKVEMGFVQSILKHGRWAIRRKNWVQIIFGIFYFIILRQLEEVMHEKMPCFIARKKTFDQSNACWKWVEGLCDPLDENNSMVEHLHKFLCQNVQITITRILVYLDSCVNL